MEDAQLGSERLVKIRDCAAQMNTAAPQVDLSDRQIVFGRKLFDQLDIRRIRAVERDELVARNRFCACRWQLLSPAAHDYRRSHFLVGRRHADDAGLRRYPALTAANHCSFDWHDGLTRDCLVPDQSHGPQLRRHEHSQTDHSETGRLRKLNVATIVMLLTQHRSATGYEQQ